MPKYEHVLPKQQGAGFAQDPPQEISNASGGVLDKELSVQTAAVAGVGLMYGKKVVTSGFNAVIQQTGNTQIEQYVEIGTKIAGYALIGIASGPAAVYTVPLAIVTDLTVAAIDNAVATHAQQLENDRILQERGVRRKISVGDIRD